MLLVLALTLALEAADGGELGHLLPVEGVAVEAGRELGLVLVLLVQLLVPLQLLARLVPGARPLDLEAVESVKINVKSVKIFVKTHKKYLYLCMLVVMGLMWWRSTSAR